jgi:3-oxoacyl-[acyl-carrier-protein] synthase-3
MASTIRVGIAGTGSYVPDRVVTNAHFEDFLETSDEWIVQRTGIRERRFGSDDQATSDLAVPAAERAIADAGIAPADLDLVLVATMTPDYPLPPTACLVQERVGAKNAGSFDVSGACTGFLTALHTAEAFVASGRARRCLVVGAEALSRTAVDFQDRSSCILFGDAAGAVVVAPLEECGGRGEILRTKLGSDGSGWDFIHIPSGGSRDPASHESVEARNHFMKMRGREVFRFAVTHMRQMIGEMLEGHDPSELSLVVPHQVNRRIIEAALERMEIPLERVMVNIEKYGNSSAATVPLAFDEAVRAGRLEEGKLVVLVAFGAGLTWGGSLLRW